MRKTRATDLWWHSHVVCVRSPVFLSKVFICLWFRMVFSGNRNSRVDRGRCGDPLGFARTAESEPRPAAADHVDDVRNGALQLSSISLRVVHLLCLYRSAG